MADSNGTIRPKKPHRDFPLFPHRTGRWAKKVRGKFCYFGKVADDQNGQAALALWLDQKDDLLAGRVPRGKLGGIRMKELANRFMAGKDAAYNAGELSYQSLIDYKRTCERLIKTFGSDRAVADLGPDDFEKLRIALCKQYGVHRRSSEVTRTRVVFKYAFDALGCIYVLNRVAESNLNCTCTSRNRCPNRQFCAELSVGATNRAGFSIWIEGRGLN